MQLGLPSYQRYESIDICIIKIWSRPPGQTKNPIPLNEASINLKKVFALPIYIFWKNKCHY